MQFGIIDVIEDIQGVGVLLHLIYQFNKIKQSKFTSCLVESSKSLLSILRPQVRFSSTYSEQKRSQCLFQDIVSLFMTHLTCFWASIQYLIFYSDIFRFILRAYIFPFAFIFDFLSNLQKKVFKVSLNFNKSQINLISRSPKARLGRQKGELYQNAINTKGFALSLSFTLR